MLKGDRLVLDAHIHTLIVFQASDQVRSVKSVESPRKKDTLQVKRNGCITYPIHMYLSADPIVEIQLSTESLVLSKCFCSLRTDTMTTHHIP